MPVNVFIGGPPALTVAAVMPLPEGLPELAYSPGGALGQYAMIVPSKNVVIVRRGLDVGGGFQLAKFSADVLKALEL